MLKKHILYYSLLILINVTCFTSCFHRKNDRSSDTNWVSLAIETERYIQNAKYTSSDGTSWKIMPDSLQSQANATLYHGTPGIVLFYLELYHVTDNPVYLNEARSGADYLIKVLPDTIPGIYEVGLYSGLSGIGFTLTEMYKATDDKKYKNAALRAVELLESAAENSANGIHWGKISEIVYGSAGIGLFLQYMGDELDLKKADSLAVLAANGLLDYAVDTLGGLRWKFIPEDSRYMDNFSHGTSGVAYFLSQTYQKTKEKKYLNAALKGAKLLDLFSNEKGYIPHHDPGGEDLYYLSWCHGPAGTSRLFWSLYEATKNEDWLNKIKLAANSLMEEGIDTQETTGYWNNAGKCCGATGVAEYYLWLYNVSGNKDYLQFSKKMTRSVLSKASREEDYMKWVHAEHRMSPAELAAQTGLMQGSAGIGLWFLRLDAQQRNKAHLIHFPDEPKIKIRNN